VTFAGSLKEILREGLHLPALKMHKTECNYFLMINKGCFAMAPTPQSFGQLPSGRGAAEKGKASEQLPAAEEVKTSGQMGAADGELMVDYEHLRVSEGPVAPVAFSVVSDQRSVFSEATQDGRVSQLNTKHLTLNTIAIAFEKNPEHRNCNSSDKVYVAALCPARGEALLSLPVYRRTKSITVELPEAWSSEEVQLYGFVQDNAGRCSESMYIGEWSADQGLRSACGDGLDAADAVECGADDAAGVAGTLAAGVEAGELGMLQGVAVAGDTHRRRRAALDG
jgi:hypothetical protein